MARSGLEERINEDAKGRNLDISYEPFVLETYVSWNYKPDYVLKTNTGKLIVIETKGDMRHFTSDYRKRWLAMYRQHTGKHDIRIIFQKNCKLPHTKTMTCSKWAEKHGIVYAIGESIPQEWIDE